MLREVERKRARFPLTHEGKNLACSMLTVESVGLSGLTSSNDASAIGHFRVGSASLASRINSCHCPCVLLDYDCVRSVFSRLLRRSWCKDMKNNNSLQVKNIYKEE